VWAVPDLSLSGGVALFCGGACAVVLALAVLCFVSMLASFSGNESAERASAFAISLLALGLSALSFLTTGAGFGGPGALPVLAYWVSDFVARLGLPTGFLQLQLSAVSIIIAYLAWRFPGRSG
jgi:hypothetical protein